MALPDVESVAEALQHVEHLALHPESHYRAAVLGDAAFIGWGPEQDLQADTYDVLLVIAAGIGGKKLTPDDFHERPERAAEVDRPATVADFDVAAFMRRIAGA